MSMNFIKSKVEAGRWSVACYITQHFTLWPDSEICLQCRLSCYPLNYRGAPHQSRHLREQALQVFACFAPFWPLRSLRLSQVTSSQLHSVVAGLLHGTWMTLAVQSCQL